MEKIQLKTEYLENIKNILSKSEYETYIDSFNEKSKHGLNFNKLKCNESFIKECVEEFNLKTLSNKNNYLYSYEDKENIRPGKAVFYLAGLYYIQEPSQMNAVLNLEINASDKVLDLCASPGGKSSQILNYLDESCGGVLISNEYDSKRAKILSSNIERLGYSNVFITNMDAESLEKNFDSFFDKILVDAPCSGEGMFRKDENAINEWSIENVKKCIERQKEIIVPAFNMLKVGGKMAYSTCTFEKNENEGIIDYLIDKFSNIKKIKEGRVYPFTKNENLIQGEGHYFCILEKTAK